MTHRTLRLPTALLLAITLVASSLAAATAKSAPLTVVSSNLSPAFVSYGGLAAFTMTATNSGTSSNIAQLYVTETTGYDTYAYTSDRGTCTSSGQFECSFGALNPGESVTVTVALVMPTTGSSAPVDFEWSSTGFVLGGNRSHGDLWSYKPTIALATGDQAGSYVWNNSQNSFANDTNLGPGNKQSTSVLVTLSENGPVSLEDGNLNLQCLTTCPSSFFGQWSSLNVDKGFTFGSPFAVTIRMYKPGVNPNQVNGVYHRWTDSANVDHEFNITATCPVGATPTAECFTATKLSGNNLMLVVWMFHNGNVHGW